MDLTSPYRIPRRAIPLGGPGGNDGIVIQGPPGSGTNTVGAAPKRNRGNFGYAESTHKESW